MANLASLASDENDIVLVDFDNPRAVVNLVPDKIRTTMLSCIQDYPQYFGPAETELRVLLKPDDTTARIRIAFWQEYHRAQGAGGKMWMTRIYAGVTSRETFYQIFARPQNVAWILTPPTKYMLALEELLDRGMANLAKIMTIKIEDENGEVLSKNAAIFLKAFEQINERVHGAVIQKIEQKNLNLSAKVEKVLESPEAIREELEALRSQTKMITSTEVEVDGIDDEVGESDGAAQ